MPADELPLTLPALVSAAEQAIAAAPPAFHIPGARQAPPAPAAYTNGTNAANGAHAAHAANGRGYAAAPPPGYPAPAREQILAPVRFVAATLPDPEPVYADEPDPDPEPAPGPPRALDADLAARITQIMAESPIPPNTMKLANSLGLTAAELADVLDALGGYDAAYSRARQDREAELGDTDAAFYPA